MRDVLVRHHLPSLKLDPIAVLLINDLIVQI
jgi:hypothetical protein